MFHRLSGYLISQREVAEDDPATHVHIVVVLGLPLVHPEDLAIGLSTTSIATPSETIIL